MQWANPRVFGGFAEMMTIASLVLAPLLALRLRRRRLLALGLLGAAGALMAYVRAGRVVDPAVFRSPALAQRVVVVTGSNQGVGRAALTLLAEAGVGTLVLCARDPELGEEEAAALRRVAPGVRVVALRLNLSSLKGVDSFVASLARANVTRVDVLVLNAGVGLSGAALPPTVDGLNAVLGVNHVAHHYLAQQLVPLLEAAPAPRVVAVASCMAGCGEPHADWARPMTSNHTMTVFDYCDSKVCRAQEVGGAHLTRVPVGQRAVRDALRPPAPASAERVGAPRRDGDQPFGMAVCWCVFCLFASHSPSSSKHLIAPLGRLVFKTVREGAMPLLLGALEEGLEQGGFYRRVRGRFLWMHARLTPPSLSSDGYQRPRPVQATEEQAKQLWEATETIIASIKK